ncbi:hypothetical protein ALC57_16626 [Trachymyrmex cornetzi]|uniref:Uncharacterized protein n=1 Tax=Trachymyrmex cornetzi TaxID=471704 RepID=A0A151IUS0_9HYME|nr:hypothetical protein ALC57_16626 [Trachymyrmex cornetzi]
MRSVYAHYHAAAVCREWALLPLSSLSEYYHPTTTVTPSTSTALICLDLTPITVAHDGFASTDGSVPSNPTNTAEG